MTRRELFRVLGAAVSERLSAFPTPGRSFPRRVVLVTLGGIRREETWTGQGMRYIPHLSSDLLPRAVFYPYARNEGVTSHFNTISSILTGVWQHVDDWGSERPGNPTLFQQFQSETRSGPECTWVVTSNKQLTANVSPGANVILSKQLLVEAVERIIKGQTTRSRLEREQLLAEMTEVIETDYERIGWGLAPQSSIRLPELKQTFVAALDAFIHRPDLPASGDELTFFIAREVMQRIAPALLMVNFSDVEVAHSGSYSLYLSGIGRSDSLCHRMWQYIQETPALRATTTLIILNEFGRDPDGSSTNGFFNHRTDTDACRTAWAMVLGAAASKPAVVERTVRQIDFAPSIASWMGFECGHLPGAVLPEFHA